MEKLAYEAYSGKQKNLRREIISESGTLDRKRFLLSASPEWKDRIRKLQDIVYELKKEYPEIISLSLYGSLTKGYANEESDIDAYLNIDEDVANKNLRTQSRFFYEDIARKKIKDVLGLSDGQVRHVHSEFWAESKIVKDASHGFASWQIAQLFLLSVGKDINKYRKVVFNESEKLGADGETYWQSIMDSLAFLENSGLSKELIQKRGFLYPKTLTEGRKYFLQEAKDSIS